MEDFYQRLRSRSEKGHIQRAASAAVESSLNTRPQQSTMEYGQLNSNHKPRFFGRASLTDGSRRRALFAESTKIDHNGQQSLYNRAVWKPNVELQPKFKTYAQYGVILDAGSSGTRLYVYKWKHPIEASNDASFAKLRSLPKLKLKKSKKIHPGIATFADDLASVGRDHLQSLIDVAVDAVPDNKISETPIYLMATAGVRLLPKSQQTALLRSICTTFQVNTRFLLPDCDERVQVISGETEGLYGWVAINYLLGGLDWHKGHTHGKAHHTYGFLDMGGASAQIAFAPNITEAERHANDLKLIRLRHLDGSSSEYKVFTATWLGFGANKARSRYLQSLFESYGDITNNILPDPCMPRGLQIPLDPQFIPDKSPDHKYTLSGTGAFDECLKKTYPLLRKDAPCNDHPCLLNGQHVPAIDFEVNHFIGVSEYWHATHGVFGKEQKAYDLATYQRKVSEFCSREWAAIESDIFKRKKSTEEKVKDAQIACFKASWMINILYEGIGIPRLGVDPTPQSSLNTTHESQDKGKQDFTDPFQPVDTVQGVEVSWTLGKMVLYAAGQILPSRSSLPVGFGSNVAPEMPPDFEHAGSVPLSLSSYSNKDDPDADEIVSVHGNTMYNVLGLMLLFFLMAFLLRKPDRRRQILGAIPWRRRYSGRKPRRGRGLINTVFCRRSANYERVLEEGDASEYELDAASDELEGSDTSEASRVNRYAGAGTPKVNSDRFDDIHPPSVMDRTGLVVRTESREHLTTNLQMLNAGRRSRAGSPTRLKSPFMIPLQDC
ncbi:Golgi apyrase [Conoideocrella luteorostrata]|uniref:Golgi apyrase n=1 Tax=Conoideocrella luteorostrata TaxID=1105319 RepID=A0AAJ0CJ02_9HYPO|nr:Golgi apyrase [Conoideocrella luteorostrata]